MGLAAGLLLLVSGLVAALARAEANQAAVNQTVAKVDGYVQSGVLNGGARDQMAQAEYDKELFDAMEITFEVSSEVSLSSPYVVILGHFRPPGAKAGIIQNWLYAESLDHINRDKRKVYIKRGGLPRGFEMVDYQVHLYNQGREVATKVSPKSVALTTDEAFEYVVIEYMAANKNATLPPVPAIGARPSDFKTRIARGELKDTCCVKVSKGGKPLGAFVDEACSHWVEDPYPYLVNLLKGVLFKPALNKGLPVEGIAALHPNQLAL